MSVALSYATSLLRCTEYSLTVAPAADPVSILTAAQVLRGADRARVVFCDALESEDEMRRVCTLAASYGKPVLANMLESGKTPILGLDALTDIGFKLSVYPLPLLGVCIGAMQEALKDLKEGKVPEKKYTFASIKQVVGFPDYFNELSDYEKFGMEWSSNNNQKKL